MEEAKQKWACLTKMALAEVLSGDLQAAHRRQDGAD